MNSADNGVGLLRVTTSAGKRQTANSEQQTVNGKEQTANSKWQMVNGKQQMSERYVGHMRISCL